MSFGDPVAAIIQSASGDNLPDSYTISRKEMEDLRYQMRRLNSLCAEAWRCTDARTRLGQGLVEAQDVVDYSQRILDRVEYRRGR